MKQIITGVDEKYRFSLLEFPPPKDAAPPSDDHLSGLDMCNYMERFTK